MILCYRRSRYFQVWPLYVRIEALVLLFFSIFLTIMLGQVDRILLSIVRVFLQVIFMQQCLCATHA